MAFDLGMVPLLNKIANVNDCLGGVGAKIFQSFYAPRLNTETGNYDQIYFRANETGCKLRQSCNLKYDYPFRINEKDCGSHKYPGVCLSCKAGSCYQITQLPTCKLRYNQDIKQYCTKLKGEVIKNGDCIFTSRRDQNSCLQGMALPSSSANQRSIYSSPYCFLKRFNTAKSCAGRGNWRPELGKCLTKRKYFSRSDCVGIDLEFVPSFEYFTGSFLTKESCQGMVCSVQTGTKVSKTECKKLLLEAPPFCNDFEYPASGLCTSIPNRSSIRCPKTHSGRCITGNTELECQDSWRPKAENRKTCENIDFQCIYSDGRPYSFLEGNECAECKGTLKSSYQWIVPKPERGYMRNLKWANVKWEPDFEFKKHVMTLRHLESLVKVAIIKVQAIRMLKDYRRYFNTYHTVFSTVNCACSGSADLDCFSNEVVTGLGECDLDANSAFKCENLIADQQSVLPYRKIPVQSYSMINLIDRNSTTLNSNSTLRTPPLGLTRYLESSKEKSSQRVAHDTVNSIIQKRCNPVSVYEVIYSESHGTSGQIIGNGMRFFITNPPDTPIKLCLTIDLSIPTNQQKYTHIDIAIVYSKLTRWLNQIYPLYTADAYFDGLKVCASIQIWPEIVYMPILRI